MQTFLPFIDFRKSVACLGTRRLDKQIADVLRLLTLVEREPSPIDHPAVLMWRGHESHLRIYAWECLREWERMWDEDCPWDRTHPLATRFIPFFNRLGWNPPHWNFDIDIHRSHRSNLIRLNPDYAGWWPNTPERMPYYWPVTKNALFEYDIFVSGPDLLRIQNGERVLPDGARLEGRRVIIDD